MNCGILEHDEDCLCDVHVAAPTVIQAIDPKTFWALNLAMDAGHTFDDDESILNTLEALAKAKDASQYVNVRGNRKRMLKVDMDLKKDIKSKIREGHSMADMPSILSNSWSNITYSLTQGAASMVWGWPKEFWGIVEDYIYTQETWPGFRALMKEFNIDRGPATIVERLYRDVCEERNYETYMRARQLTLNVPTRRLHWQMIYLEREGIKMERYELQAIRTRLRCINKIPKRMERMEDFRARTGDTSLDDDVN